MANTATIAATRKDAFSRLHQSMRILGDELGVEPIALTQFNRDPEWLQAKQLSEMADYLEGVVKALHPVEDAETAEVPVDETTTDTTEVPVVSPYAALKKAELQALADERKLTVAGTGANGNVLVSDLQAALSANDAEKAGGDELPAD